MSDRSIYAAGAMALLYSSVDSNIIKIFGRWLSNKMLRYPQMQTESLMRNISRLMLMHGSYYFLPHQEEVPLL